MFKLSAEKQSKAKAQVQISKSIADSSVSSFCLVREQGDDRRKKHYHKCRAEMDGTSGKVKIKKKGAKELKRLLGEVELSGKGMMEDRSTSREMRVGIGR